MSVTRRNVFIASGAAAIAAAFADVGPASAEVSTMEKNNTQLVSDFCQAWGAESPDPEKIVSQFMGEECVVRFGDSVAPVSGRPAVVRLFRSFLSNDERYELKILETFARGPVVVNARTDSTMKGTRRANPVSVIGVFVIRDGKIKEWSDYV
jgi:limonene-1,2-epoxide hydrolase